MTRVCATDVSVAYLHGGVRALDNVSLDVAPGELVALLGPSGCGKSTLLNVIAGLVRSSTGKVRITNDEGKDFTPRLGFMFARDALLPWRTAHRNVTLGLDIAALPRREKDLRADRYLEMVGLTAFQRHYPAELSQGMRQRVALARTLAMEPDLILMDEPFAALDAQTRRRVQLDFLRLLQDKRQTVILVTHDVVEAVTMADRVVVMSPAPGRIRSIYDMTAVTRDRSFDGPIDPNMADFYLKIWNDLAAYEPEHS